MWLQLAVVAALVKFLAAKDDCYNKDHDCFHYGKEECHTKYAYGGTRRHTVDGILCQRWDEDEPNKHHSSAYRDAPENYCRDPKGGNGPWCYTTDKDKRYDFCFKDCGKLNCYDDEKKCFNYGNPKCKRTDNVYHGTWNKTVSGRSCQKWKDTSPHNSYFKGEIENYCRNPRSLYANGPWCYTTDPDKRWEICFKDCAEVCQDKPVDLLVLMDGSESIKPLNFTKEKELVINIVKKLPADSRISVMQFSTKYRWYLRFNSTLNLGRIKSEIAAIKYMNRGTYTARALRAAFKVIRKHKPKNMTMLALTDGEAEDWKKYDGSGYSLKIRRAGVKSYAIGIGKKANSTQLKKIVGKGNEDRILTAKFSELDEEVAKRVVKRICTSRFDNGLNGSGKECELYKDST